MDLDEMVSAFQTAFDNENDEEFADLCHEHDQPLVRTDPEPFTYPVRHDVGLRAHYAGLGHGASGDGMEGVLSDARGVLASLRSAATAAQVGGATAAGKQPPLHIGTLSVPQVVCDAPPPANREIDAGLHPVSASDPASFGSPFEEPLRVSFMDRVMPTCPGTSLKLCSIDSDHEPVHTGELSVIDDDDDSDGYSFSGDEIPSAPPATRSRVGVATLPRVFSFASLALPALMCLACVSAVQGSVVLDRAPEFTAADEEPFTFSEDLDVGLRAQYAGLAPAQPSLLATRVHEARTALRELKQVAGGAESETQHFPMVHFGSATPSVIDGAVVEHEPKVTIETEEDAVIYPKQCVDGEPPFGQSFMDNMSVKLGFFEPEPQVSLKSFNPLPPYISSTHDSASVTDTESDDGDLHDAVPPPAPRVGGVRAPSIGTYIPHGRSAAALPALFLCVSIAMIDTVTATALCDVEIAPPSVVYGACSGYQNGTVDYFPDPDLLDTGPADFYKIFNLDSDGFGIYGLNFQFENYNNFNICELYSVDHSQGG
ncbi:hypothetical protein CYMTET_54567 [Cymbomonas tetramitiformis]|uniref:Uncharacterized protein n=1 Tax=Cymbomonas tetramitiformis TaxID=36881 RepID=A0AAE0BEX6_9CHLO|nr:hypothetical protein CYMTET_54567 [Cymbomonas tetramitiformis]